MTRTAILIVPSPRDARPDLISALARDGYRVATAIAAREVRESSARIKPDIAILEDPSDVPWRESVAVLRRVNAQMHFILLAGNSSEALAIAALRAGFTDYLPLPFDVRDVVDSVRRCCASTANARGPTLGRPEAAPGGPALVGDSAAMTRVREEIARLGPAAGNVLITGETGTGKELVAEMIHAASARRARPFVSVNCAAVPDTLLESELFGFERGAFTSAEVATVGRLEEAHGGTVFLDEIGDMTPLGQAKILRVTDGKEWSRLGGRRQIRADLRFVAATNQDLEALMASGRFRPDLYFRLNAGRVELVPLRDRREDVPLLLEHYTHEYNARLACSVEGLTDAALTALVTYDWPGNVRELRNVVEALFAGQPARRIGIESLPPRIARCLDGATALVEAERDRLLGALAATRWNKSRAAAQLHWSRMTLYRKMLKHGVTNGAA